MNLRSHEAGLRRPDAALGNSRYRVMSRLLDVEDVEFLKSHGANPTRFRRQRCSLFLRFLKALERDIEKSLRQRLLHEHWDMLQIAQEKIWVRSQIWKLRMSALAFAVGLPSSPFRVRQDLSKLVRLATL